MLFPIRTSRSTSRTAPHRLRALLTAGVLAGAGLAATTAPAHAATTVCDQFGSTTAGSYVVQNNAYNASNQCISVDSDGFQITQAPGSVTTNGAPKSYPSMFIGCHYTNCSPGTNLPRQVSAIGSVPTSISFGYVGDAVYDASYDIWLDPTPKTDGVNQTEIMIWLNRVGAVQPVGSQTGTVSVDGTDWGVWQGNNGTNNVISFVAPSTMGSASLNVKDFVGQAISAGLATDAWYLTSVQAGFEPWENGAGLAVNSFSASVN